jgi:ribose 5-phosphate isomerase B
MRIAFANDHRGALIRNQIIQRIEKHGHEVIDFGSDTEAPVDYPDYAAKAAEAVARKEADRAVLVCGTGIGMSIAANKIAGIRCAACTDEYGAQMARSHNDANILALRATHQNPAVNLSIVDTFLDTEFEGGRHLRRVNKIRNLERF